MLQPRPQARLQTLAGGWIEAAWGHLKLPPDLRHRVPQPAPLPWWGGSFSSAEVPVRTEDQALVLFLGVLPASQEILRSIKFPLSAEPKYRVSEDIRDADNPFELQVGRGVRRFGQALVLQIPRRS